MVARTGLRMTRQREAILQALRETDGHPTADEIYQSVRAAVPHISLGTVYRNLSLLADEGLVKQLGSGSGACRFDGDLSQHYHVRCAMCERVDDACIEPVASLEEAAREVSDYRIDGHVVEFSGRCPDCQG